jgi:hypothetical protein
MIPKRDMVDPMRVWSRVMPFSGSITPQQRLTPSEKRIGLIVSSSNNGHILIGNSAEDLAIGGICLAAGASPLLLNIWDHGKFIQDPIWDVCSLAGDKYAYVDILYLG